MISGTLAADLAKVLPAGHKFTFHHISSVPTTCPALYAAPLTQRPEKTYVESHFLTVSWKHSRDGARGGEIAVFAIEALIFTTTTLTTLFVSKADSTGYLSLLNLPRSSSSALRSISCTFIAYLVRQRHRPDRRLVVSLFARAQEQYLFPGSIENSTKHVLTDRQLVKWWCKTLDPLLREYPDPEQNGGGDHVAPAYSKAYLIVPGHDRYETSSFFPQTARLDPSDRKRWISGHPLRDITPYPNATPRSQIPHFPDDPKNRFLMDLDEELQDVPASQQHKGESPSKRGAGHWKSVRTLEQFWELMAFRQECSSGRLVSFLWLLFTPKGLSRGLKLDLNTTLLPHDDSNARAQTPVIEEEDDEEQEQKERSDLKPKMKSIKKKPKETRHRRKKPKHARILSGPIIPRSPRVKSATPSSSKKSDAPETTRYYHSPLTSRGTFVLSHTAFNRVTDMLLRLDFANIEIAKASTKKWADEVAVVAGQAGKDWGVEIEGLLVDNATQNGNTESQSAQLANEIGGVNVLSVKKRKRDEPPTTEQAVGEPPTNEPRTLGAGLIRKKPKPASDTETTSAADSKPVVEPLLAAPNVNVLGGNLVRKKPKT